jgi:hypothetical protein
MKHLMRGFMLAGWILAAGLTILRAQEIATPPATTLTRTYESVDGKYRFTYPLEYYSVRMGCPLITAIAGTPLPLPSDNLDIIANDSTSYGLYRDLGVMYRISIISFPVPDNTQLDSILESNDSGYTTYYGITAVQPGQLHRFEINGVPALWADSVQGLGGSGFEVVAIYKGLQYQIFAEPISFPADTNPYKDSMKGFEIAESIVNSFEFIE